MRMIDIIAKKRNGHAMTNNEIEWLISGYMNGNIPDYQISAWLMAVFFSSMTTEETSALTMAMAKSGTILDLSSIAGTKVDKHSTGGVADTTTLILVPLVAAAGVPVAKMSGRGLGFTGGTVDKLESIPGFKTDLMQKDFIHNINIYGAAICGQTPETAPADGRLYALRDVTATVESIPLIASSIMSKKIAAGADKIVLDVKVGRGAFMKTQADAIALATAMVNIGKQINRETVAFITSMDAPLGAAIGNTLEVEEAFEVLAGKIKGDLLSLCLRLGAQMLVLANKADSVPLAITRLQELIDNGTALRKFDEIISAQGGVLCDRKLPQALFTVPIYATDNGYVKDILAEQLGYCAMRLGAGREEKSSIIDTTVGLVLHVKIGNYVKKDTPVMTVHTNCQDKLNEIKTLLQESIVIGNEKPTDRKLILGMVNAEGFSSDVDGGYNEF